MNDALPTALNADLLTPPPVLHGSRVRLDPLGPQHLDSVWSGLHDPDTLRLTGTRGHFDRSAVATHLATIGSADDRADWAIVDTETGDYLGEIVLNELDEDNASMNFRIALLPGIPGRGYGTEASIVLLDFAFGRLGLHRIFLDVYSFNPRALRSYEKAGFVIEGRQRHTLNWGGEWADSILMGILSTDPRPAPTPGDFR
jgi:RimJ/RimL family protein N-acetyltransferase